MGRKIITTMAISLDGLIADAEGGFGWIAGDGDHRLDTAGKWDFARFLDRVGIIVMGRRSYDQNLHTDFREKRVWVATTREAADHDNVRFIRGDVVGQVLAEQETDGGDIYLFGGSILLEPFIRQNRIDEYIIGIVPVILGAGQPLFLGENPTISLKLDAVEIEEGICVLHYTRR